MLEAWGLPGWEEEAKDLIPGRRYRFDLAERKLKIAIEIQGGIWMGMERKGAHALPTNHLRDMEKANLAQIEGYIVLQFTPQQFDSGQAYKTIMTAVMKRTLSPPPL